MAIAAPDLAAVRYALRIDDASTEATAQLTRAVNAATALANRQAPDAPADVAHEAIIRAVGWLYDGAQLSQAELSLGLWTRSGAKGLLAPWQVRRAGLVEAADG